MFELRLLSHHKVVFMTLFTCYKIKDFNLFCFKNIKKLLKVNIDIDVANIKKNASYRPLYGSLFQIYYVDDLMDVFIDY
jgi:hypothetical protein